MSTGKIRNFCIIAHIDHGKSTLADRILEITHTIEDRKMQEQVLDNMDLERERGITIKAQAVSIDYKGYRLNLIDTPGHVDFSYEVSRSLAACEGALLVIDAAQGIEAQTVANIYLALEHDLEIIPVINKIDLPAADIPRVKEQLLERGIDPDEALLASAKEGTGVEEVLDAVIDRIPAPKAQSDGPLKALVFDSLYNSYQGVIAHIRVMTGSLSRGEEILLMASGKKYEVDEVGIFTPDMQPVSCLEAGEVGYLMAGIKNVRNCKVGDTITKMSSRAAEPLPGYQDVKPMVFSGLYPTDNSDYEILQEALEKLQLNDAAFTFENETSAALGFGFRCGFLGLLHMEIVQERLEREFDLELIITAPSVVYRVTTTEGDTREIDNPAAFPEVNEIETITEPYVEATLDLPEDYIGSVMELCEKSRGNFQDMTYLDQDRVRLKYEMPMSEIITDFFNQLKSKSRGYATLDYEPLGYRKSDLVKLDILVNKERVDALSVIVHRDRAEEIGRDLINRLKDIIPRKMFTVPLQAAIGSNVVARENIKARKKDVLQKCYGGDVSRKRKLLEKQKEGKKRLKQVGDVEIPQEAFMAVLERGGSD